MAAIDVLEIGFIGLGAMGLGMASNLHKKPLYRVTGYDVYPPSAKKFASEGGNLGQSPREVAQNSKFLICMAANEQQVDDILFHSETGALKALLEKAIVLICSTVSPGFHELLLSRIAEAGRPDVNVIDAPVSGGTVRAADGTLTIFASGAQDALDRCQCLLQDMSEHLYHIPGGPGAGSKVKMVNQLLVGIHIATACEAMALAATAGLDTKVVYDIISNAAGSSWAFANRVPHMLEGCWESRSALDIFVKDMGIVMNTARSLQFPLPLSSIVEQLWIWGSAQGYGREDDAGLVRCFLPGRPEAVKESAGKDQKSTPRQNGTSRDVSRVAFIGLGAMGQGASASLLRGGYVVSGYDVSAAAVEKFASQDKKAIASNNPAEAIKGAEVVFIMVQNAAQVDDVLFGSGKAIEELSDGAVIVINSTVPPSFIRDFEKRLEALNKRISIVDAPVSGGAGRAANGTLAIILSGPDHAISKLEGPLMSMAGSTENLHYVQGGVGAASSVKLINQLLAGVHIAAAAEAMALAARLGLDTRKTYEIINKAAGWSWMFENRVPQMLDADWTPYSSLAIFVKDMGIVVDEAKRLKAFAPISSAAHTLYISGASQGLARESDAGVVRFWETMTGISVAQNASQDPRSGIAEKSKDSDTCTPLPAKQTLDSLPSEYALDITQRIREPLKSDAVPILVVLDDDPTGTQTCHDIDVLMNWDDQSLDFEFSQNPQGFFILTNSRSLPPDEAKQLTLEICANVKKAAEKAGKSFEIVLRSDSTLRGHLFEEMTAVEEVLGHFDGLVLTPFFFQGGRLTINDVHYVQEGDILCPASQTPFAQDATFGYKNSNLREYVLEKCGSRFNDASFVSITIEDIRVGGPSVVAKKLLSTPGSCNNVFIVNAAAESDMYVFVAGLLEAAKQGRRYLYRTGAAFVSSRLGINGIPPLTLQDLGITSGSNDAQTGGLIIAGSYVPKTTAQLKQLRERRGSKLHVIELEVADLLKSPEAALATVNSSASEASSILAAGKDVLVMTSRKLITGQDALTSLQIGSKVAQALVDITGKIETKPRYLIAKGGITSSDAATKGLRMRRAKVLGQAAAGVPLWRCDEETCRYPGLPYVVFPGNVGSETTLAEVVEGWALGQE